MRKTHLSVLVPAYNHEAFVAEAIESALAVDADDLEVLVVDDGSSDSTAAALEIFAEDPRFRLCRQENRGAHATLNRLLEMAQGDFFFILDSDDVYEPERLERLTTVLETNPDVALAASWVTIIDDAGRDLGVKKAWKNMPPWPSPGPGPYLRDTGDPRLALLEANWVATTSNFAFRRELVADHGLRFANLRYCHDWDFLLSAAAIGDIEVVEEPLLRYRVHSSNTIREGSGDSTAEALMQLEILWTLARHTSVILDQAAARGMDRQNLEKRRARSQPFFGNEGLMLQLRALRGDRPEPSAAFDALLEPSHPLRQAALELLSG